MPSAPAVMPEPASLSPSPARTCVVRPRSPLANGSAAGDFELRHWRTPNNKKQRAAVPGPPPVIEIPHNGAAGSDDDSSSGSGSGYTSLRDILSSREYAVSSPAACAGVGGGGGGSCGDIHMIRNPLVKHAAYAYLQMTPSAREDPARRRARRWHRGGPLCRLLRDCLSFVGALFSA